MKIVLPGLILFALWSLFCVRWYVCGIHELCQENQQTMDEQIAGDTSEPVELPKTAPETPLAFDWSGFEPLVGNNFEYFKDSLQEVFDSDPAALVEITGLYDPQELNTSQLQNLGLARAQSVKDLLLASGIKRSIEISARPEDLSSALGEKIINGVSFQLVPAFSPLHDFAVMEKEGKLIVYFPLAGESPESSAAVRAAVDKIAQKAVQQGNTLLVIGHTDDRGEAMDNKKLGLIRATKITAMLIASGVSEERVLAESEGEDDPVTSNRTAQGRQQNRRVEIVII